jgi:hypothetical protein
MHESLSHHQLEFLTQKMLENLSQVKYGEVSVCIKKHDSRVVSIIHTVTQNTRDRSLATDRLEENVRLFDTKI